jgi:hypothetical protein
MTLYFLLYIVAGIVVSSFWVYNCFAGNVDIEEMELGECLVLSIPIALFWPLCLPTAIGYIIYKANEKE